MRGVRVVFDDRWWEYRGRRAFGGEDEAELGRRWTARRRRRRRSGRDGDAAGASTVAREEAIDFKGSEDPSEAAWIGQPNEYVCAMRNRRRREAEFEEHVGSKWSPGATPETKTRV